MQKNMTDRTPGSYDDFVAYLGTVRTEEELFSRLTYWFAGQNRPEDSSDAAYNGKYGQKCIHRL